MRNLKLYIIVLIAMFTPIKYTQAQSPLYDSTWVLQTSLSDEFSGNSLNTTLWQKLNCGGPGYAWGGADAYNNGTNNCRLDSNGHLILRIDSTPNVCFTGAYRTGGIWSNNYSYQYGYLEVSMQLPGFVDGSGHAHGDKFHPAFWTYLADSTSAGCLIRHDELDIEEPGGWQNVYSDSIDAHVNNETNTYYSWYQYYYPPTAPCTYGSYQYGARVASATPLCSKYHNFAAEWNPDQIIYYFDSVPIFVSHDTAGNTMRASRIVLNAGIDASGSFYPGTFYPSNTNGTRCQFMKVDYFHYWKLNLDCTHSKTIQTYTPDLTTYYVRGTAAVKSDITFGDNTGSISLLTGHRYVFRAVNTITINGEFVVPSGAEFTAVPTPCY